MLESTVVTQKPQSLRATGPRVQSSVRDFFVFERLNRPNRLALGGWVG